MDIESELKKLAARLDKVEGLLLSPRRTKQRLEPSRVKDNHAGATGGIRLLVSKGYFRSKRKFPEIIAELKKQGYLYSKQAFQDALTRLSRRGGPLTSIRESGIKVYAQRK